MELILNTFGVSLNRDNEAFVVTSKDGRKRIPVDGIKSIQISCYRIQKSIFLANLSMEKYEIIKSDLVEVQSLYENHDSIIVCPVSSDLLRSMKIIGHNINIDVITQSKNTLFF